MHHKNTPLWNFGHRLAVLVVVGSMWRHGLMISPSCWNQTSLLSQSQWGYFTWKWQEDRQRRFPVLRQLICGRVFHTFQPYQIYPQAWVVVCMKNNRSFNGEAEKPMVFGEMAMDQYLYIPFLVGWTSIYQLFWCELQGYKVLTHPQINGSWGPSIFGNRSFRATSRSPGREIFAEPGECHIDDPIRLGCGTQQLMGFCLAFTREGKSPVVIKGSLLEIFPIYLGFS